MFYYLSRASRIALRIKPRFKEHHFYLKQLHLITHYRRVISYADKIYNYPKYETLVASGTGADIMENALTNIKTEIRQDRSQYSWELALIGSRL